MTPRRTLLCLLAATGTAAAALTGATAGAAPAAAVYKVYTAPVTSGDAYEDAVEPTIGANWKSGRAMVIANVTPYSIGFDDRKRTATWTAVPGLTTNVTTLDPILWSDSNNGRTIISQLSGTTSLMEVTDDDGESYVQSQGGGPSGVDHQTVGGGPFAASPAVPRSYPEAVWYCSQAIAAAFCSISTDGGISYLPSRPISTLVGVGGPLPACGGLHGHVNVRPDGTAMVPIKGCSPDAGTTLLSGGPKIGLTTNGDNNTGPWTTELVPDSTTKGRMDPYVDADQANTTYLAYVDGTDKMKVAVKKKGAAWAASVDVGRALGVKSTAFPLVIGGSAGRAAVAYLGSKTGPVGTLDAQNTNFTGTWQLYVSTTLDSGRSWSTRQVTTDSRFPVQVGCIRKTSSTCDHRNLYDFNGITVDKLGRVLVVAADGCTPDRGCVDGVAYDKQVAGSGTPDDTNVAFVVRQECGPSLFASQQKALDRACASFRR